jgi:hypothetical protein
MSRLSLEEQSCLAGWRQGDGAERYAPTYRQRSGGLPTGLLVTGLVALGVGALAWFYLGPELRRYMNIRNM